MTSTRFPASALLLAACAACAAPFPAPRPDAGASPTLDQVAAATPAPEAALRVATWNIEWLSADGGGEVRRVEADYEALGKMARSLDADVLALQEVDGGAAIERVLGEGRQIHVETRPGAQRVGIAVRDGLSVKRHEDFEALGLGQRSLRRGVDLTVGEGSAAVRFLAVHLKGGCRWDPLGDDASPDCRKLGRQGERLESWIDARAREGASFVVLGDFNRELGTGDAFWDELDDGDPASLRIRLPLQDRREQCRTTRRKGPVDHMILGGRAADRLRPGSARQVDYPRDLRGTLSDHCPIVLELAAS